MERLKLFGPLVCLIQLLRARFLIFVSEKGPERRQKQSLLKKSCASGKQHKSENQKAVVVSSLNVMISSHLGSIRFISEWEVFGYFYEQMEIFFGSDFIDCS